MKNINNISGKNILVIGDVMLDTYYRGDVKRISPEAPVPVFHKKDEYSVLGGAANVASNLIAAGQNVSMMTIIGDDEKGNNLKKIFFDKKIDTSLVFSLKQVTTEKIRFLADNNQQVLRLDIEITDNLKDSDCIMLLKALEKKINSFDLIVISDYMKGLLTYNFVQGVIEIANRQCIPVLIDVKDRKIEKYKGAYLLKPNRNELADLTGMPVSNDEEMIRASECLKNICNCKYVLATCGSRGMVLIGDGEPYFINCIEQEVYDVTGAGDTTIAYLAASLVNNFTIRDAVDISNCAAGIQVSKVGTSDVDWNEVRDFFINKMQGTTHKLVTTSMLNDILRHNSEKKVVFTNGCFDIIHVGHIRYLQEAKKLGDILIVGLNSDSSVRRLKGDTRPVNSEKDRAEVLSALEFVDYVIIFEEDTPYNLISQIRPDVLVKGGDYSPEEVVGKDIVESYGGNIEILPFVYGKSTTNIIKKIRN